MSTDVREFMEKSRKYLNEAMNLLNNNDPYDATEKIWAAVKNATIALTLKYLNEAAPPNGMPWRQFVKTALMKAGLNENDANEWAAYFIDVRSKLHGDCFYGLNYEESEHKPLIEKAGNYIDLIERLVES